jgi:hypothetical protein
MTHERFQFGLLVLASIFGTIAYRLALLFFSLN